MATQIKRKLVESEEKFPDEWIFIYPYEIYGHMLLFLERSVEAKELFGESLLDSMVGRAISLLGLARAHAMLGNTKQATFFYRYLRDQYQKAAKDNPVVIEAEGWLKTEKRIDNWFWPYFAPESAKPKEKKGELSRGV